MIVALLNQKGGVGKTTLALHLAGAWARRGLRVTLIDADPQSSALDWSEQRARQGLPAPFSIVGIARDTLHREAPAIARRVDHVVIDGSRLDAPMRSTLLASDLALLPVQPSPFDGWGAAKPTRWALRWRSNGGSCSVCAAAVSRARTVRAGYRV